MAQHSHNVLVYHYDAFSMLPNKGNPAGVVLNADDLTTEQMQSVARAVGFNETVFVLRSDTADVQLRYFTPGHENNLCGHATIAACYALHTRGVLGDSADLTLETKAGMLPIHVAANEGQVQITMTQASPQFLPFRGSRVDLAAAIGLTAHDLHPELPILYGSTGIWTLLVPIRRLEAFARMVPHNDRFPSVLGEMPRASVHPFCLETLDPSAQMHGRHFSSPYSGTIEDAVTGTASGVMGAYYREQINPAAGLQLMVEQGFEVGRDGRVTVYVDRNPEGAVSVRIGGTAVYVREFEV